MNSKFGQCMVGKSQECYKQNKMIGRAPWRACSPVRSRGVALHPWVLISQPLHWTVSLVPGKEASAFPGLNAALLVLSTEHEEQPLVPAKAWSRGQHPALRWRPLQVAAGRGELELIGPFRLLLLGKWSAVNCCRPNLVLLAQKPAIHCILPWRRRAGPRTCLFFCGFFFPFDPGNCLSSTT